MCSSGKYPTVLCSLLAVVVCAASGCSTVVGGLSVEEIPSEQVSSQPRPAASDVDTAGPVESEGQRRPSPRPPRSTAFPERESALNDYAPFMAMGIPGYTFRVEPDGVREPAHGLVFTIPFEVRADQYRHGGALAFTTFPRHGRTTAWAAYRIRMASFLGERPSGHLYLGLGGFWDRRDGVGPRAELGLRIGRLGKVSMMITWAYQYAHWVDDFDSWHRPIPQHATEFSIGAHIPYIFR